MGSLSVDRVVNAPLYSYHRVGFFLTWTFPLSLATSPAQVGITNAGCVGTMGNVNGRKKGSLLAGAEAKSSVVHAGCTALKRSRMTLQSNVQSEFERHVYDGQSVLWTERLPFEILFKTLGNPAMLFI